MNFLPLSVVVTGMHMHYVNVRGLVLRSAGRPVAKLKYERTVMILQSVGAEPRNGNLEYS
jgi:hypothetical protein